MYTCRLYFGKEEREDFAGIPAVEPRQDEKAEDCLCCALFPCARPVDIQPCKSEPRPPAAQEWCPPSRRRPLLFKRRFYSGEFRRLWLPPFLRQSLAGQRSFKGRGGGQASLLYSGVREHFFDRRRGPGHRGTGRGKSLARLPILGGANARPIPSGWAARRCRREEKSCRQRSAGRWRVFSPPSPGSSTPLCPVHWHKKRAASRQLSFFSSLCSFGEPTRPRTSSAGSAGGCTA